MYYDNDEPHLGVRIGPEQSYVTRPMPQSGLAALQKTSAQSSADSPVELEGVVVEVPPRNGGHTNGAYSEPTLTL